MVLYNENVIKNRSVDNFMKRLHTYIPLLNKKNFVDSYGLLRNPFYSSYRKEDVR